MNSNSIVILALALLVMVWIGLLIQFAQWLLANHLTLVWISLVSIAALVLIHDFRRSRSRS